MKWKQGLADGFPICLGYFAVSFALGLFAVEKGCTIGQSVLLSVCNLTSAGQFAGITVMAASGSLLEMAVTQFVINLRYMLMSISLSQKMDESFSGIWRWILGYAVTDEIFAVAISRDRVSRSYFSGLIATPILGWGFGTFFGALLGNVLPSVVSGALGVALYGMFIAIVIPQTREDVHVLIAALIAVGLSVALYYIPALSGIPNGFAIIICTVVTSLFAAWKFPVEEEEDGL